MGRWGQDTCAGSGEICCHLRWLSPWCAFLARALCRNRVKVPYDFHSTSQDSYRDMSSGRRYESGSFGEKQEHGNHYGSLKWKLLFPWYLQKSTRGALGILQVQHLALCAIFFPSLGILPVWTSQRRSPLASHSKSDKMRDRWSPCMDGTSANVHMHKVSAPPKKPSTSVKPSLDNLFEELIISMFAPRGCVHFGHCSLLQLL